MEQWYDVLLGVTLHLNKGLLLLKVYNNSNQYVIHAVVMVSLQVHQDLL